MIANNFSQPFPDQIESSGRYDAIRVDPASQQMRDFREIVGALLERVFPRCDRRTLLGRLSVIRPR